MRHCGRERFIVCDWYSSATSQLPEIVNPGRRSGPSCVIARYDRPKKYEVQQEDGSETEMTDFVIVKYEMRREGRAEMTDMFHARH